MKFALILFVLFFLTILWLIIDFQLGREKHLKIVKKMESPILYGYFDIFSHGMDLFADYFRELKKAKHHIHILFYIVENDKFSHEFLDILKEKSREGIEIRLLTDRIGSKKITKKTVKTLREAGVEFAFSNRIKLPFLFYSAQVRNHRKISIIDGSVGYLGGFNIGKEYVDLDPKLCPWRDYHLKIKGQSVPFLQRYFLTDWKEYAGIDLLSHPQYFLESNEGDVQHQLLPAEASLLEDSYMQLIQQAEKSILIGTPYFIPSAKIFTELIRALQRGIRLTIVVPYISDHILVQEASYRYLRILLKEGAQVYQYQNGFYHAKTVIIDEKISDIGTANFDKRSFFLNKEINCYIYSEAFTKRVHEMIKKDIRDSKLLLLEDLNKPNLFRSVKEGMAAVVSYFL